MRAYFDGQINLSSSMHTIYECCFSFYSIHIYIYDMKNFTQIRHSHRMTASGAKEIRAKFWNINPYCIRACSTKSSLLIVNAHWQYSYNSFSSYPRVANIKQIYNYILMNIQLNEMKLIPPSVVLIPISIIKLISPCPAQR